MKFTIKHYYSFGKDLDLRIGKNLISPASWDIIRSEPEKKRLLLSRLLGKECTFAGYLRTKDTYPSLWTPAFKKEAEYPLAGLLGFLLKKQSLG